SASPCGPRAAPARDAPRRRPTPPGAPGPFPREPYGMRLRGTFRNGVFEIFIYDTKVSEDSGWRIADFPRFRWSVTTPFRNAAGERLKPAPGPAVPAV